MRMGAGARLKRASVQCRDASARLKRAVWIEELEPRRLLTAVTIADSSFESPTLSSNSYAYNPTGSAWTFSSTAGIVNGASALGAPTAPSGSQVAFLQTDRSASQYNGGQDGAISQTISIPTSGYYSFSAEAAADASDVGGSVAAEESFMVELDGTPVLTGLHPTSSAFSWVGGTFYAPAGSHTLSLVSTGPDSTTTFLDEIQLNSVTAGPPAQLVIKTVSQSLAVGDASSSIALQLEDSSGLLVPAGSGGVTVNLSTTSNLGTFFGASGSATTTISIPAGNSATTFTYEDGRAGTPTITASAVGLTSAAQQESVENVTSSSFLRTSGTHLVNGSGKTVQLRGVNLGSWLIMEGWMSPLDSSGLPDEYGVIQTLDNRFGAAEEQSLLATYQQNWITVQDLQNIRNEGFNVIRVPVWWADFETLQGQWRSDAFNELDWVINTAGSMGIYTIIDMHGVVGGQSLSDDTGQANLNDYWTSTYDQEQTDVLMQNIALHYKNNPYVAGYDLMNEPDNAPSDSAVIAADDRLYDAVRSVDTNHIAIIEGTFDAWNWSMLPTPASQGWSDVVYEMHEYQWSDTDNPSGVESGTDNQVSDFENHAYDNVPDYVGEFNDFDTGESTWQYTFQKYDNNNINWSFWAYKATDGTAASEDSWGLYDPISNLRVPNIQTASSSTIDRDWSDVTTSGYFAINSMLQSALAGAGVATAETAAPVITGVAVGSTSWSSSFLSYLSSNGLGSGGYAIPTGTGQLADLPWVNLNQITIQFDEPVNVVESDLVLNGVNVPTYRFSGFSYNASSDSATWTLSAPIGDDRLRINLSDAVTSAGGEPLAGGWTDGSSTFPSGAGASQNFVFSFNVLPGDVNQDGSVLGNDVLTFRSTLGAVAGESTYSIWDDLNGDGSILGNDVLYMRTLLGMILPSGTPA